MTKTMTKTRRGN